MNRDLRDRISEALDALPDDVVRTLIEGALTAEKAIWVTITCKEKDCGHTARYEVVVPDWQARAKALDLLATQGKGKPPETLRVDATVRAKPLEAMTLAELDAEEARLLESHPDAGKEIEGAGVARGRKPARKRKAAAAAASPGAAPRR